MEALGVVSSVLAIAAAALHLSQSTYETISSFRSHRQDIEDIRSDLSTLTTILELIRDQAAASPSDRRLVALRGPLTCCQTILQHLHESLAQCTKHATNGRESVRTWLQLRFREKSFAEAKERLSSYKATLCIAFDSINIRDRETTQTSLDELTRLTDRTREELEDQLDQLQKQISTTEKSLQATLDADRAQIQVCLKSLEEAQTVRAANAQIVVSYNRATGPNTRLIAGTDTSQPVFDLSATHNRAEEGASMSAGVYSTDVVTALLQHSSARPAIVSIVQTMQTGSFGPQSPAVQAFLQQPAEPHRPVNLARRIEESPVSFSGVVPVVPQAVDTATGREL